MRADGQGMHRGWSGVGEQSGCMSVYVCTFLQGEAAKGGSLPLGSARGTPSCAWSQAHPSHPYSLFGQGFLWPKGTDSCLLHTSPCSR